jgi:hypothetical protein
MSFKETNYENEFYEILNDLVRIRLTDVSFIIEETKPVYRTMWGNTEKPNEDTINPPPPPPPGFISYDKSSFNYYVHWKKMDSLDAQFMFNAIDSLKTLKLDSKRTELPVINKSKFLKLFKDKDIYEGYNNVRSIYGTSCFIVVSTPIFNEDFTKVLISIDYTCGPTWGQGYEFLLEKRNGKWWLIDEKGTWES